MIKSVTVSYMANNDSDNISIQSNNISDVDRSIVVMDTDLIIMNEEESILENSWKENNNSNKSKDQSVTENSLESGKNKLRTFCLIIALMIHSFFEGLIVGLQRTTFGLIALIALITFHKCILGFSLGLSIAAGKVNLRLHVKQAVCHLNYFLLVIYKFDNITNLDPRTLFLGGRRKR